MHPERLDAERSTQVCGQCHGMRWWDEKEQWRTTGFDYRPGEDLAATTPMIQPTKVDELPWLESIVERRPDLLRDFFWSDGMIRVAGREYNGLLETACHTKGEMSCLSCHSMHDSDPNDMLSRDVTGNQACLQCHESMRDEITTHTYHAPESEGSQCYNCHMPHTTYSLLKAIRSHEVDSPNVSVTQATGRPNACNLCHLDKTLQWTADNLTHWYGHESITLEHSHQQTAASLIWLLQGNAVQRTLASWHMTWKPTFETSSSNWRMPFMIQLLNDNYAATRYVTWQSLKKLPEYERIQQGIEFYKFVSPAPERVAIQQALMNSWSTHLNEIGGPSLNNPQLMFLENQPATIDQTLLIQLLQTRDDTSILMSE